MMNTPIAILLGIIVLAVLGFAMWYLNRQASLAAVQRQRTGLDGIFAGLGQTVSSIGGVIN